MTQNRADSVGVNEESTHIENFAISWPILTVPEMCNYPTLTIYCVCVCVCGFIIIFLFFQYFDYMTG